MKKTKRFQLITLLVLTFVMSTVLSACDNDVTTTTWKVTFNYNYTGAPSATVVEVNDGETVDRPAAPTRPEYDFKGWCIDSDCTTPFDFTTPITADITLYAKWELTPVFVPDPEITRLDFESSVTALEGTWKVVQVYANGSVSDAVADAITLSITAELDPYELVDGEAYIHNQVYNLHGVMTFGLPAINEILDAEEIPPYRGLAWWEDFSLGEVVEEGGFYKQPGPAIMKFGADMRDFGLFLDLVAGISTDIQTNNSDLIIGMNKDGQLLLGYSTAPIQFPEVNGNWSYCLIFDKE